MDEIGAAMYEAVSSIRLSRIGVGCSIIHSLLVSTCIDGSDGELGD